MKNYTLEKTKSKDLFRVVDVNGNWENYFHKPSGRYLRAVNDILNKGYCKGKGFEIWLKTATKEEAEKKLKDAGERGDKVHKAIDFLFENKGKILRNTPIWNDDLQVEEKLAYDEWECIMAFHAFWEQHKPILLDHEYPAFNLAVGYAGTLDSRMILSQRCQNIKCSCAKLVGKIGIYDWKSSSGIRDQYGPQIASYAKAENVEKYDYTAILRLGTNHKIGYEFEVYNKEETERHFKEFLAAMTIAEANYKPFDPDKRICDIPEVISITLQAKHTKKSKPLVNKIKKKKR